VRTLARIGFDRLLEMHSTMDVVAVDWQSDGPWLLVTLGQPSTSDPDVFARFPYAIFKRTGAVHGMRDGAVNDEPQLTV
jgi:hypothetical protein